VQRMQNTHSRGLIHCANIRPGLLGPGDPLQAGSR
jgi:hypothetical protein